MPVTQDRLTRLREFGLSEYAARSYLALLDLGIAEARDVSSISKVPQAKIYHVLEQLHDKGLVVILPEFPKKYAPVPFEEYLGRLYEEHTKAAQAIEDQRADLAEMFRVMGDTDVGDRGFFTVIRGRRNVLGKIEEMIAQTQRELMVLGTSGTASRAAHMIAELRRARERNVRVRMLAPVETETLEKLAPIAQVVDLRARELGDEEQSSKVAIVVSDSARAFLIHFVPDDANLYSGKDIGVFTDQEAMVAAIQAIVEPHWARAGKFEARRDEILHGRAGMEPADLGIGKLFYTIRDAIVVADARGTIVLWSPGATRVFGLDVAHARGKPITELVSPEALGGFGERIRRFRERAEPEHAGELFESVGRRSSGERFPVEVTLDLIVAPNGERYVLTVLRDITGRRRVNELLAATIEATSEGLLVISKEGRISGSNRRFREMWRIPEDVMASGDDERAISYVADQLDDPMEFAQKIRAMDEDPDAESHDVLRFRDGRVVERSSKPQRVEGKVVGRVWSFREVAPPEKPSARVARN